MCFNTDDQIYSVGILLFFFFIFLIKAWYFFTLSSSKRYLRRYRTVKKLKKLTWSEFEFLCKILFEEEGWKVKNHAKKGADGGVDLWIKKRRIHAIVQCKKYEDARVTVKVIREMYGLMYEYDVDQAFVVTTSEFTKECYKFVQDKPIELFNGEKIIKHIYKVTS